MAEISIVALWFSFTEVLLLLLVLVELVTVKLDKLSDRQISSILAFLDRFFGFTEATGGFLVASSLQAICLGVVSVGRFGL